MNGSSAGDGPFATTMGPSLLSVYSFARQAHAAWDLQCEEGAALPFEASEVDRPPQQKTLAALAQARKIKALLQGSTRMHVFREHMTLPDAKTWVQCRPSKTLRTLIKPLHFTTWMKYYCRIPTESAIHPCFSRVGGSGVRRLV